MDVRVGHALAREGVGFARRRSQLTFMAWLGARQGLGWGQVGRRMRLVVGAVRGGGLSDAVQEV